MTERRRWRDRARCAGPLDPAGPWGDDGGRVYSAEVLVLTLQTPYRHERLR